MSRQNTSVLDGVEVGYGTRDSHNVEDAVVHTMGRVQQVELRIDHTTLAGLDSGVIPTSKSLQIPVGAAIKSAKLIVLETFTDLTDIRIGTKGADGVTEDDNGLITEVQAVLAELVAGDTIEGTGAQIDAEVTDEDLFVSLVVNGTPATAGEAVLVVEYYQVIPTSTPPAPLIGVQGSL